MIDTVLWAVKSCAATMSMPQRPRLIVFDLDNTLWTPELYQLKRTPKAGKDIWLFEDVQEIIFELATDKVTWGNTRVAIASRTNKVDWAHGARVHYRSHVTAHHDKQLPRYSRWGRPSHVQTRAETLQAPCVQLKTRWHGTHARARAQRSCRGSRRRRA